MRIFKTFLLVGLLLAWQTIAAADDVLWKQSRIAKSDEFFHTVAYYDRELKDAPALSAYMLAGVVVQPNGWHVESITVYFETPSNPAGWLKVTQARLNIFASATDLPQTHDDPRNGKIVSVAVKLKQGYCLLQASSLNTVLAPGRYWIGLTPISEENVHGHANHLRTQGRSSRGIESVVRQPGGDGLDFYLNSKKHGQSTDWLTLQTAFFAPFDESIAIKIEGKRLPAQQCRRKD